MQAQIDRRAIRRRVRYRVRRKVSGTAETPRLAVFRSLKHIYAQAIDDARGHTVAHASTRDPDLRSKVRGSNKDAAKLVGEAIGRKLQDAGVDSVVFDRGGFVYHGCVKALADAARETGLKF